MQTAAVAIAAIPTVLLAHEATHYVACRLVGADATVTILWDGVHTSPAIETDLRDHTPATLRAVAVAPLVLLVPAGALALAGPATVLPLAPGPASLVTALVALAALPSWLDIEAARHADTFGLIAAVDDAPPVAHCTAEGV